MIKLYTDGACSGNPGPGGWACIILNSRYKEYVISGYKEETTNNEMELTAVFKGLFFINSTLNSKEEVQIFTDSKYISNAINSWIYNWKKHGWKTSTGTDVSHKDIWMSLFPVIIQNKVKAIWIKGHNSDPYNLRCDTIARNEIVRRRKVYYGLNLGRI
jgi:ribonuclease HI